MRIGRDEIAQRVRLDRQDAERPGGLADEAERPRRRRCSELSDEMEAAADTFQLVTRTAIAGSAVERSSFDTWDTVQAGSTTCGLQESTSPCCGRGGEP